MSEVKFLFGTEEGQKQEWLEGEKARLKALYPDMETVTLFAFDCDAESFEDALFSTSLFSSYTLVVLKHYEEMKKDSPVNKVILKYLSSQDAPSSLVVLSSQTSYNLPSALSKALKKDQSITFWEMYENQKQDWIRNYFRKEGYSITADAVRYILDMIDNNTLEMKNTCSQLALFFRVGSKSDNRVDLDDISAYLSHNRSEDGFSLFAAIAKADLAKSLSVLKKIMDSDSRGYMGLVSILLRQFRLLESFISLRSRDGEEAAFQNATALSLTPLEVKGIRTVRDKQTFRVAAGKYTLQDVDRIISYLDVMDTRVKSAGTDEVALTLELMVYTIIVDKGMPTSLTLERELFDDSLGYRKRY